MSSSPTHLRRSLGLAQLLVMGVILVQPTAPMPPFGAISAGSNGHVVTTVLIAMFAMLLTAISYGRMARAYPNAGSAYTYVAREIHPVAGYLTGWSMLLDYVVNPLICVIWISRQMMDMIPMVPYAAWACLFALLFVWMNLRGIQTTARMNEILAAAMGVVVVWMLFASARYLSAQPDVNWIRPFYDPERFTWGAISNGASIAVLTYIGFDGISTLSEEVHNPRRNILLGMVGTCLIIGILSAIQVYAAQLVWPASEPYPAIDNAYVHIARRAGGALLFTVLGGTLVVASMGSGAGGMLAGARLLYGMGREGVLPQKFFAHLSPTTMVPDRNVLLIGALCLAGAFAMSYQLGAELLNFGALFGFMGVNASSLLHYVVRRGERRWSYILVPALGFLVCLYLWLSLSWAAKLAGGIWVLIGMTRVNTVHKQYVKYESESV